MNKEIRIKSESIRNAGKSISKLNVKSGSISNETLSSTGGLVSSRMMAVLADINEVGSLLQKIFDCSPDKLNRIADAFEASDRSSAMQFK